MSCHHGVAQAEWPVHTVKWQLIFLPISGTQASRLASRRWQGKGEFGGFLPALEHQRIGSMNHALYMNSLQYLNKKYLKWLRHKIGHKTIQKEGSTGLFSCVSNGNSIIIIIHSNTLVDIYLQQFSNTSTSCNIGQSKHLQNKRLQRWTLYFLIN